jgi:hypothetical protein
MNDPGTAAPQCGIRPNSVIEECRSEEQRIQETKP